MLNFQHYRFFTSAGPWTQDLSVKSLLDIFTSVYVFHSKCEKIFSEKYFWKTHQKNMLINEIKKEIKLG